MVKSGPVMEAGLTDRVWTLEEIAALADLPAAAADKSQPEPVAM